MIGVFQVPANRQAARQAGDAHGGENGQPLLNEQAGGVAFHAGVGGDDDFLHLARFDPIDQAAS